MTQSLAPKFIMAAFADTVSRRMAARSLRRKRLL